MRCYEAMRWGSLVMLMALFLGCLVMPLQSQAADQSHNNKDFLTINKITPCTGGDIPTPCSFPVTMELSYKLASVDKGKLRVGVFLRQPGSKAPNLIKSKLGRLQPLLPYVEKDITKGTSTVTIATGQVQLPAVKGHNCQLIVVANIHDMAKKELCWATSYAFVRGTMSLRTTNEKPTRDTIQVMSYSPMPKNGPLYTGRAQAFTFNLKYSLRSKKWGYAGLELRDQANDTDKGVWYNVFIPIQQGCGVIKIVTREFFFPVSFAGRQMMINLPFRVDPLGGTVNVLSHGSWPLQLPNK